jgi:hypothetical protein
MGTFTWFEWDGFPHFAEVFTTQVGAKNIDQVDGTDVWFWDI